MSERRAKIVRTTDQGEVTLTLDLDGGGDGSFQTGSPFLDHMLDILARHAAWDLEAQRQASDADDGELMEEVGFCLGLALDRALGAKTGISKFGHCCAPSENRLARAVVEISGQACLAYHGGPRDASSDGIADAEVERFWRAFVLQARLNLHLELLYGGGGLPAYEAVFKAAARALGEACRDPMRFHAAHAAASKTGRSRRKLR
jgi:imidazoleglycerol-phosphate dehydratase